MSDDNDAILQVSSSFLHQGPNYYQWRVSFYLKAHHSHIQLRLRHPSTGRSWLGLIPAYHFTLYLTDRIDKNQISIAAEPDGTPLLKSKRKARTKYGHYFQEEIQVQVAVGIAV